MNALRSLIVALALIGCIGRTTTTTNAQLLDNEILDNTIPETDSSSSAAASSSADGSSGSKSNGKLAIFDWVKITESPPPKVLHPHGTSVELECEATGSPSPTISWVRGKNVNRALNSYAANVVASKPGTAHSLVRVRSRLIIDRTDAAAYDYSCVALAGGKSAIASTTVYGPLSGGAGGIVGLLKSSAAAAATAAQQNGNSDDADNSLGYTLHANRLDEGLRKPRIVSFYSVIFEMMGNDVFLPCSAVGAPKPDLYWLDNEERMIGGIGSASPPGSRLHVTKDGALLISAVQWSDMGTYRCVAHSPLGKDVVSTFVYPVLN